MKRFLFIIPLILALLLPVAAHAGKQKVYLKKAENISYHFWKQRVGNETCGPRRVDLVRRNSIPGPAVAQAPLGGCEYSRQVGGDTWIEVEKDAFKGYGWGWVGFCSIMIHEWGHLSGKDHNHNPNSIMNAQELKIMDRECGPSPWRGEG